MTQQEVFDQEHYDNMSISQEQEDDQPLGVDEDCEEIGFLMDIDAELEELERERELREAKRTHTYQCGPDDEDLEADPYQVW